MTLAVSMVPGASGFAAEREGNTMESLPLTPVSKLSLAAAKYPGVLIAGVLLYMVSVPYLIAIGAGSGLTLRAIFVAFFGGLLLLTAFLAISVIFSIVMKCSKASVLTSVLIPAVLTLPALVQGMFRQSPIGAFILKMDPVACCFHVMSKMLTDKVSFFSLGNDILPLVLFAVICVAAMAWFSRISPAHKIIRADAVIFPLGIAPGIRALVIIISLIGETPLPLPEAGKWLS